MDNVLGSILITGENSWFVDGQMKRLWACKYSTAHFNFFLGGGGGRTDLRNCITASMKLEKHVSFARKYFYRMKSKNLEVFLNKIM